MKIFNTLTRSLDEFKPIDKNLIRFYHCGPTVYWVQHIGNMRAVVCADFIRRSLLYLGYQVTFVRNYTDVGHLTSDQDEGEDKMEKGSKREGLSPNQIAEKYIQIFNEDIRKLNTLQPTQTPRATEFIPEMIAMVQKLVEKKYAYITEYAVYFDVSTFPQYNLLNKQKVELNVQGSGKGNIQDPNKKHFADFALWFFKKGAHKNALQTWNSPWGIGFPGWHIECSAMAKKLLGDTIDIHMGGVEHISVHHTNEIAQSESANGVPFCHYWIHNEHLNVENTKMAKSEGTSITLHDIEEKGVDPLDLRYFFLQAHYRSKQNFTWEALESATEAYGKLKDWIIHLKAQKSKDNNAPQKDKVQNYRNRFSAFLSLDFEIPQALALLWEVVKSDLLPKDKLNLIFEFDSIFGLQLQEVGKKSIPQEIIEIANERLKAKQKSDFSTADQLRREIEQKGFIIEDTQDTFLIKPKK